MKKTATAFIMTGFLLCGAFFSHGAAATPADGMPAYQTHKSLSDFLPVQGEGRDFARGAEGREMHKGKMEERRAKMMERIEKMPPEEREKALQEMEAMKAKKEALRKELESLPPEEREARMQELHEEFRQKQETRREEFQTKFQERWSGASEEERAEFCGNARQRCAEGGNHACEFAKTSCSSAE